jgi:uncharacterized protein (DUF1684 family)
LIAWQDWRAARNRLFKDHSQSPLDTGQRARFRSLAYFAHDPSWRVVGQIDRKVAPLTTHVQLAQDGAFQYSRFGRVRFEVQGSRYELSLFWIQGYGGGLFLPFGDKTNGSDTYGGGRYLYDTIKGADLGPEGIGLILDFNYAYNPSCAYNSQWVCPLTPPENKLPIAVTSGERSFKDSPV